MARKKLLYGTHEIRLRDDQDLTVLRHRLGHDGDGFVDVVDYRGATHALWVTSSTPFVIVDETNVPESTPRAVIY